MSDRQPPPTSVRLYRVLLRAYPRPFWREYGPQMEQTFRDLYRVALLSVLLPAMLLGYAFPLSGVRAILALMPIE
jgi:hypothetical protein